MQPRNDPQWLCSELSSSIQKGDFKTSRDLFFRVLDENLMLDIKNSYNNNRNPPNIPNKLGNQNKETNVKNNRDPSISDDSDNGYKEKLEKVKRQERALKEEMARAKAKGPLLLEQKVGKLSLGDAAERKKEVEPKANKGKTFEEELKEK